MSMAIATSVPAPMTARMIMRMGETGSSSSPSASNRKAVIITSVMKAFQKICTTCTPQDEAGGRDEEREKERGWRK